MGGEAELRAQRGGDLEGGAAWKPSAPGARCTRVWYGQAASVQARFVGSASNLQKVLTEE